MRRIRQLSGGYTIRSRGRFAGVSNGSPSIVTTQSVVAGAVLDADSTIASSFTSGTTWANIIAAPADGSLQSAYDLSFTGASSPTFTGSAGSPSAYFALDGGDYVTIAGGNTALINGALKTTGGNPISFWMCGSFVAKSAAASAQSFVGNSGGSGNGFMFSNGTFFDYTNKGALLTRGDTNVNNGTALGNDTSDGTNKFIAFTYDPSTRVAKVYAGATSTPQTFTQLAHTATMDATYALQFFAGGNGATPLRSGSEGRALGMANTVLSDSEVTALRALYSTRHGTSY
jgi:hypothetical protein